VASHNKTIHHEWLNSRYGYFYTVSKKIHACRTTFQKLELVDTDELGKVLILDGITQVAENSEFQYHELMVHPAMCTHPDPRRVLVIGAGDGGILREVLRHRDVEALHLAELDEGVIKFSKKHLRLIHQGCFSDPRVHIHIEDGRKFVEDHPKSFDVVIMDMTDPFGPSKYLYTKDFFAQVKRSFRSRYGVFVMHTESPVSRPKTFAAIQATLRSEFRCVNPLYAYIQMYAVLWSITVASDVSDAARLTSAAVNKKISRAGIHRLKAYNGDMHRASLATPPYIADILKSKTHIITDRRPDIPDEIIHR
jgi:spermidine synthase